jgi:hypothetical protein
VQDRPTSAELLAAVREFLTRDLAGHLTDPRLRYRCLIAASVLAIVERESDGEAARLGAELARLDALLGRPASETPAAMATLRQRVLEASGELSRRIRTGEADRGPWRARVLEHVRASVEAKVAIDNPAELGPP